MDIGIPLFPEQASDLARDVDMLFFFLIAVSMFFVFLIGALLIYFIVKFRRRSNADRPDATRSHAGLEIAWTVIPLILTMIMFVWGAVLFFKQSRPPSDAMEILVVGKQWMWKIQHPTGHTEINELHVPLGQPVKLNMTSEDVIHSFYVPAFRVKMDVLPGRYTTAWFTPNRTGRFHLFCAEYCGTEHSKMVGSVNVLTPVEYERWLAGEVGDTPADTPVEAGRRLFTQLGCATCHHPDAGALGPDLAGVFGSEVTLADGRTVVADEDYLRQSILDPRATLVDGYEPIMPTFRGLVNEQQLMQLISYIKSLGDAGETGEGM